LKDIRGVLLCEEKGAILCFKLDLPNGELLIVVAKLVFRLFLFGVLLIEELLFS
jgi:hypothetical protein